MKTIVLAAALLVAGLAHNASAAPHWQDSAWSAGWAYCGVATNAKIGYWLDLGSSPHTGDVSYIHAMAQAGCAYDTVGFDFLLPATVQEAVSATNPVYCFKNGQPMGNSSTGACSQTAQVGNFGGAFYGWSNLAPGEWFEIQIPVRWFKSQPGTISAALTSGIASLSPSIQPSIIWRPTFANMTGSSSVDGTSANVAFEVDHYYAPASLVIEYGSNGVFDHATPAVAMSAQAFDYPNVTANLPGTTPLTTLSWRVKVTAYGNTYYSDTQTVALSAQIIFPHCTRFPC